jgi:hypothetical protein
MFVDDVLYPYMLTGPTPRDMQICKHGVLFSDEFRNLRPMMHVVVHD